MEQTLNTQWTARMVKTDGQIVCLRSGSRAANSALVTAASRCRILTANSGDLSLTLAVMGRDLLPQFSAPATRAHDLTTRVASAQPLSVR